MLRFLIALLMLAGIAAAGAWLYGQSLWQADGPLAEQTNVIVPRGSSQDAAAVLAIAGFVAIIETLSGNESSPAVGGEHPSQ